MITRLILQLIRTSNKNNYQPKAIFLTLSKIKGGSLFKIILFYIFIFIYMISIYV